MNFLRSREWWVEMSLYTCTVMPQCAEKERERDRSGLRVVCVINLKYRLCFFFALICGSGICFVHVSVDAQHYLPIKLT